MIVNKIIDLSLLHSNTIESVVIDEDIVFEKDFYENTDIQGFNFIHVAGYIKRSTEDDDIVNLDVNGEMVLLDSISNEEVNYPFSFKIEDSLTEILGNCPNTIDILELLWENIVLEVPLKFTTVEDFSKFQGDGWKLVSDEDTHKNNPFNEILKEYGEE